MTTDTTTPSATEPRPATRAPRVALAVVLAVFAMSRLALLSIPSEREFDEGVYLLSARALAAGHDLFTTVFSSQPPAFLETLAVALEVIGDTLETGRLLTLGFAVAGLLALASLARRAAGPWAAPLAAGLAAFSVTYLDLAHVVQAESPALALALLSLALVERSRARDWSRPALAAAGAAFGAALLFKLVAAPLAVPLAFLLLLEAGDAWRFARPRPGEVLARGLVFASAVVVVLALPLPLYDHAAMWEQTVAFHVAKHDAFPHSRLGNLVRIGHYALDHGVVVATALAGALLGWKRRRVVVLWGLAWLAAAVVAVTEQSPLFWRHFVLLTPPLALLAAAAVAGGTGTVRGVACLLATVAAAAQGVALSSAAESLAPWSDGATKRAALTASLRRAGAFVAEQTATGDYVAGDDLIVLYLSGREASPGLTDTSLARIQSGSLALDHAKDEARRATMVVLRKQGRLSRLKGFVPWVTTHFRRVHAPGAEAGGTRSFWLRRKP